MTGTESADRDDGGMPPGPVPSGAPPRTDLHSRGYLLLLLTSGVLGIPLSLAAFGFLVVVHELEHVVWHDLPNALGHAEPPAWWPVVTIGVAGLLVALAVRHLPGHGGHVPVDGLGAGATLPTALPGVALAEDVTGPYDVIVRAEAKNVDELGKLVVSKVQNLDGITRTLTCPVVHI